MAVVLRATTVAGRRTFSEEPLTYVKCWPSGEYGFAFLGDCMTVEQLREMANRCRKLMAKAQVPEIREQLETWAIDFETEIEEAERSKLTGPDSAV